MTAPVEPPVEGAEADGPASPAAVTRRRPNPLAELALPGSAVGRELRSPLLAAVVLSVVAVTICYLLVGTAFAIIGGGLVIATFSYRLDPGRPAAMVAFLFAVGAALATIFEYRPQAGDPTLQYAANRPGASTAGNMAGALMAVAAIMFGLTERADGTQAIESVPGPTRWLRRLPTRLLSRETVAFWAPVVSCGVIGIGLRTALGARATPVEAEELVRNVRMGVGYATKIWAPGTASAAHAPLGVLVAAFSPIGDRASLVVASIVVTVLAAWVATQWRGRRCGVLAAAVVAVVPAVWDATLAVTLAGAFVLGIVALLWRPVVEARPVASPVRLGLALGVCAGGAVLARPDAVVALPVLGLWVAGTGALPRLWRPLAGGVALAGAMVAPWVQFVLATAHLPFVAPGLRAFASDPGAAHRLPAVVVLAADAAVAAGAVVLLLRAGARGSARHRGLLPFVALPAASVVVGLVAPFDRGLLSWSAPVLAVAVAVWVDGSARSGRPARRTQGR